MSFLTEARHFGSWLVELVSGLFDRAEQTPFRREKYTIYGALAFVALQVVAIFGLGIVQVVNFLSSILSVLA